MIESKIFQTVLLKLRKLGFLVHNWSSKFIFFRIFTVISVNVLIYTYSPLWFILFKGKAFGERTESFFFLSNGITTLISHYILVHQRTALRQSVKALEGIIQKRNLEIVKYNSFFFQFFKAHFSPGSDSMRSIYDETNEKIEKWTKFCY